MILESENFLLNDLGIILILIINIICILYLLEK